MRSRYDWRFWLYRDEADALIIGALVGLIFFLAPAMVYVVLR